MDNGSDDIPCEPPEQWLDVLAAAEADAAAGRVVSGESIHRTLRETITKMQGRQTVAQAEAVRRR